MGAQGAGVGKTWTLSGGVPSCGTVGVYVCFDDLDPCTLPLLAPDLLVPTGTHTLVCGDASLGATSVRNAEAPLQGRRGKVGYAAEMVCHCPSRGTPSQSR